MTVVTVVTSISYKAVEYEGCKNFMVGNAAETTGDRTWPQNPNTEQNNSHNASVHMYPTDDYSGNTTQQTCTKPLLLSIECLYQTDGPYFLTGPQTLPTKLTHRTHIIISTFVSHKYY